MDVKDGKTRILAVSNELSVLSDLEDVLKKVFPGADVIKQTDPLMACKYSFNNQVDYAFASEDMRRMSGSDLLQFIKKEHPTVNTYLIFNGECCVTSPICDDSDGVIKYPFTVEELAKLC